MEFSLGRYHQFSCTVFVLFCLLHAAYHQCRPDTYHTTWALKDLEESLDNS